VGLNIDISTPPETNPRVQLIAITQKPTLPLGSYLHFAKLI
ncbi:uncharacterized protein METZ01_LOCUS302707, partial [marine metagenome]